ncbi:MAG: Rne/Rng family ribonuclease, partial [Sphingomonadales bacterium]|nr:Rne/Rng family ribonuclease [Sphingomonadales bacterium]
MSTRMLIDARHTEETRVAVVKGNKVEDFDYESSNKVQIKGNIYLAKITRVEPSLQAAFVEYGGNRHGFLAFSEIHPDYYQIPVEDREALVAEETAIRSEEDTSATDTSDTDAKDTSAKDTDAKNADVIEGEVVEDTALDSDADNADAADDDEESDGEEDEEFSERLRLRKLRQLKRRYKIQEVIKPRQIMLIQVVKEERGNKGAALTSYISLAGRYTVLMPNTTHGGGISRKISNATDRKRLKSIVDSLEIPAGTGCIIRTAGMKRTKTEIKRDVEYIQKIWSNIRELTLKSVAPSMVYEEGNLIKRAIRDLYDRSIDEVQVEGDEGYKIAKEFMTLLMPSHAKRVHHYKDGLPLFQRYQVEEQLDDIFNPNVTLKSGGYLVINPTEALISIDVNSGKSTKQHNIESTAFKTNLEAAMEIGRQLRLRDLAGLVVIDFIDMEERSHNRKVESKMKEAVKADRARIMVNRISSLGLMEISRQRLRPNLEEASSEMCVHCQGSGRIRNKESAALHVLRAIENEGYKGRNSVLSVALNPDVAFYVLNHKRQDLVALENKYGIKLELTGNSALISPNYEISASGVAPSNTNIVKQAPINPPVNGNVAHADSADANTENSDEETGDRKPRRRRRRGGRGRGKYGRNRFQDDADGENTQQNGDKKPEGDTVKEGAKEGAEGDASKTSPSTDEEGGKKQPRRRGRRGGRRSRYSRGGDRTQTDQENQNADGKTEGQADSKTDGGADSKVDGEAKASTPASTKDAKATDVKTDGEKKPARRRRRKPATDTSATDKGATDKGATEKTTETAPKKASEKTSEKPAEKPADEKPKRRSRAKKPVDAEAKVQEKPKKTTARRKTATSKAKTADSETVASVDKPKATEKATE